MQKEHIEFVTRVLLPLHLTLEDTKLLDLLRQSERENDFTIRVYFKYCLSFLEEPFQLYQTNRVGT